MRGARFWVVTIAAGLSVVLTASLGQWQMGRASTKLAWQAQLDERQAQPVIGWDEIQDAHAQNTEEAMHFRSVVLRGRWMHEATVFLDNRPMTGQVGFVVVTPLIPEHSGPAVLVQRGWVPRHAIDRTKLPSIPQNTGWVEVSGVFVPPPSKLYQLGPDAEGPIRQNIDVQTVAQQWTTPLVLASVQLTHVQPPEQGFRHDWPVIASNVHKHYGYAAQWFSLSALILLLYVWFQIIAPRRRAHASASNQG
jgi:surfeit locus 1 family protein